MASIRREQLREWIEYLPYWLIISIVAFVIVNALWVINSLPNPHEVHDLPTVHVYDLILPESSVHPDPSGKLR